MVYGLGPHNKAESWQIFRVNQANLGEVAIPDQLMINEQHKMMNVKQSPGSYRHVCLEGMTTKTKRV